MRNIPSETQIVQEIKKIVFGKRVKCIHCSSRKLRFYPQSKQWFCRKCRRKFSIKSVCWLKNMKISWTQLWLLLVCWQKKYNIQQAVQIADVSVKTSRGWYEKFRQNLPRKAIFLKGDVEIDELYTSRRKGVFGAIKRHTKEVVLWVPKDRPNKSYAKVFLESVIHPDSHLFTDGSVFYRNVKDWGFRGHTHENHSKFEFGETSQIEGLWGCFRTFIRRMYHHIWEKNLEKYVTEFNARYCHSEIFENPLSYLKNSLRLVPT